ncbi:hypothetical protein ACSMEA_05845 [Stenotrophomonas maltophilia]
MKNKNYARLSILSLALLAVTAQAQSLPSGEDGTKAGNGAVAKSPSDVAIGNEAEAYNDPFYEVDEDGTVRVLSAGNTAVGTRSKAIGELNTALGNGTTATGKYNTAVGAASVAEGERNFSAGLSAYTNGMNNTAVGSQATAEGESSISVGTMSYSNGVGAQAIGGWSEAEGDGATATGYMSKARAIQSTATGHGAQASGEASTATGSNANATARGASAFGTGAGAHGENCTALGAGSSCFEENTVSVGQFAQQRRIVNVADGINDNEAVNYGQLRQFGNVLGNGFGFDGGTFYAPVWNNRDGTTHTDVSSVFNNFDERIYNIESNGGTAGKDGASAYEVAQKNGYAGSEAEWLGSLKGDKGEKGDSGLAGADSIVPGPAGQDGRDGADSTVSGPTGPAGQDGKDSMVPGPAGQDGAAGSSAYELAVKNGFQGNESTWLDSLKGLDGANGTGGSENPYIAINDDTTYDQNRPAEATGTNAIAAGNGARAVTKNYVGATAVGANSYAEGDQTTATGSDTIANGDFTTATGSGAIATANAATASGANSRATEDGSTAVGTGASATAKGATAVGNVASAEHENSVAVGTGTVTSEANQVAVGNRKISQVAPGRIAKNSTDAINGSQLYDLNNEWNDKWSKTNDRINGLEGRMKQFDKKLHGVCAMQQANAQVAMSTSAIHNENRNRFGVGIGGCSGQAAFAAGYTRDVTTSRGSPSAFSIGISSSEAGTAVGAGWSIGW